MKLSELLSTLKNVQTKIGASDFFLCGGVARDKYMKRLDNISDIDITSGDKSISYLASEFENELKKKYNLMKKDMPDGHSTIFIGNLKIDFSSNFNAPNIENILISMGIKNPTPLQKEIYSRDFTCNTLLMTPDLKSILDPTHKGFKDIQEKKIKTCLSPQITLTTNKNRVIRAIYLACKLDFELDQSIIDFVKKYPQTIKISTEKSLTEKLNQAFEKNPNKASELLTKMNLWSYIPITKIVYPYYEKYKEKNGV
jgi:poly(A) polymerase